MARTTPEQIQNAIRYVRGRVFTLENGTARELLGHYQRAYEALDGRLRQVWASGVAGEKWTANDLLFTARTDSLMRQIDAEMASLNAQVYDTIVADQMRAYRMGYYGNGWLASVSAQTNTMRLPLLPNEAIRAAVLFPYEDSTTFFRLENNRTEFIRNVRNSVVQSQIQGETIYQAQKRLSDALGLPIARRKLADRQANSGNFYRTEMIARTEILRASNLGAMAVYDANEDVLDGWEFTATLDDRTCPICGPLDGKQYDLNDTTETPPKHPNCILPGNEVVLPGVVNSGAKSLYIGRAVEIVSNSGRRLTVTENHPILTSGGWVAAKLITQRDNVVVTADAKRIAFSVNPYDDHRPIEVEQRFNALVKSSGVISSRMKVTAEDFHGDARFLNGDVEIVERNGFLLRDSKPAGFEAARKFVLNWRDIQTQAFAGLSRLFFGGYGVECAAHGVLGGFGARGTLCGSGAFSPKQVGIGNTARGYAVRKKAMTQNGTTDSSLARQFLLRFASNVSFDKVVEVRHFDFSGHVYDLQCDPYELYICNGIVVKNCRCSSVPVVKESFFDSSKLGRAAQGGAVSAGTTYAEWARGRGIANEQDGGIRGLQPSVPPKSPGASPVRAKPTRKR